MTDFEIVLLQLVAKGNGKWTWYNIGIRLPGPYLHESANMYKVLKKLADEGFLFLQPGNPLDTWELTPKGRDLLL